jgi:hypothetical protein
MADYADVSEIDDIEKSYVNYPQINEIATLCCALDVKIDNKRTIEESDAWAYYYELKSMVEQQHKKTA